jgi:hypothetical protein
MRSRLFICAALFVGILTVGTMAVGDMGVTGSQKWIIANLVQPTVIAGTVAQGPVLIVHDDKEMANGGPCTTVYRYNTSHGRQQKIVSFMCQPVQRDVVDKFTMTCSRPSLDGIHVLVEYQFPGDTEAHRVPSYVQ